MPGYSGFTDRRDEQNSKIEKFLISFISFFKEVKPESKELKMYHGGTNSEGILRLRRS